LLAELIGQCPHRSPSYNDLASGIESIHGHDPSRQAVALRLNPAFERFLETLLGEVIAMKINKDVEAGKLAPCDFRGYRRVLVQDSTVIKLPTALFESFSGVANAHSAVCNARIQAVYDLIGGRLITFSIDPYSKNDLSAAPELRLMEGDLVLRDRGYLTAAEMQRHWDAGAHFIYRHKTGMIYLDAQTLQPIDLAGRLKERGTLDMEVLLNHRERTRVRLLAAPVSKEAADLRRMRARKEDQCGKLC
jgi:Transposase DDE domain